MDDATLQRLLDDVSSGAVHPDDAVAQLRRLPWADLGFARVDHHRALRQGLGEAVYGPGKTAAQVAAIVGELLAGGTGPVVVTRVTDEQADTALGANPAGDRVGST
ncbi:MAG: 1-(5-phosphoribosyl)-5-amino-4-imidazole-carboxylate carboxylase, partial [Actinomycetota bacterium]|nr:1-(5-phosphoribosyl)-5-amino-4-imidazole-carboxylate carboxylase [Actinomycetota bacterium]